MPETTPDDILDAHADSIRDAALLDLDAHLDPRERCVLVLDSRDPLGRDLAHLSPGEGQPFLDALVAARQIEAA